MLNKDVKETIQQAYSRFLSAKSLKPRYGQKLMIAEIARTLGSIQLNEDGRRESNGHICVVEAGTGTGKTIAYLLSTLCVAKALGKRVVLSTATVALQEQVVLKDLPELIHHSELPVQFRLAKGRGRYLCLAKLDKLLGDKDESSLIPLYEDEESFINEADITLYTNMMTQLAKGEWDGDRDNWDDEIEQPSWQRVTTDHRQCTGRKCSHVRNCSFFKAREALDDVDCVVANHDLVLADLALGGGAILPAPEDTIYIFDEGHHLPEKALNHFSSHTRYKSTIRWLGQSEGQWPSLVETVSNAEYFVQLAEPLEAALKSARASMEAQVDVIASLTAGVDRTQPTPRMRFENGVAPHSLELLAQDLRDKFLELTSVLEKLYKELSLLIDEDSPSHPRDELESLYPVIGTWLARAEGNALLWTFYCNTEMDPEWPFARWITLTEFNDITDFEIVASPILASRALQKDLWSRCCGAVVTSATITALNSFDRFKYRAGTYDDSHYAIVPSPFKYKENATLYIPRDAVEANNAQRHTESIIELLPKMIEGDSGVLVLFSSRKQMFDVHDNLDRSLQSMILMQGIESKQAIVKQHKAKVDGGQPSVIFGLASFAEGMDLPGAYCTHVVIAKIPFSVPDDPLEAALSEWVEASGGNAFMQVSVPDASMRLIQACGRLLRTEEDSGKITILDKRIITKRYGKALLEALPPFTKHLNFELP